MEWHQISSLEVAALYEGSALSSRQPLPSSGIAQVSQVQCRMTRCLWCLGWTSHVTYTQINWHACANHMLVIWLGHYLFLVLFTLHSFLGKPFIPLGILWAITIRRTCSFVFDNHFLQTTKAWYLLGELIMNVSHSCYIHVNHARCMRKHGQRLHFGLLRPSPCQPLPSST